ncbi:hypothetical protein JAAARDRAFT_51946, partial [Jaapia argillacea MUCL 33604]
MAEEEARKQVARMAEEQASKKAEAARMAEEEARKEAEAARMAEEAALKVAERKAEQDALKAATEADVKEDGEEAQLGEDATHGKSTKGKKTGGRKKKVIAEKKLTDTDVQDTDTGGRHTSGSSKKRRTRSAGKPVAPTQPSAIPRRPNRSTPASLVKELAVGWPHRKATDTQGQQWKSTSSCAPSKGKVISSTSKRVRSIVGSTPKTPKASLHRSDPEMKAFVEAIIAGENPTRRQTCDHALSMERVQYRTDDLNVGRMYMICTQGCQKVQYLTEPLSPEARWQIADYRINRNRETQELELPRPGPSSAVLELQTPHRRHQTTTWRSPILEASSSPSIPDVEFDLCSYDFTPVAVRNVEFWIFYADNALPLHFACSTASEKLPSIVWELETMEMKRSTTLAVLDITGPSANWRFLSGGSLEREDFQSVVICLAKNVTRMVLPEPARIPEAFRPHIWRLHVGDNFWKAKAAEGEGGKSTSWIF